MEENTLNYNNQHTNSVRNSESSVVAEKTIHEKLTVKQPKKQVPKFYIGMLITIHDLVFKIEKMKPKKLSLKLVGKKKS